MVNVGKTKRLLEAKEFQCHSMGFLCNKQCFSVSFRSKFKPSETLLGKGYRTISKEAI
jgi:hypothetical protein